ncbi:MAG: glycosyltransferase family A protein [Candidatus Babeliales bacterium]
MVRLRIVLVLGICMPMYAEEQRPIVIVTCSYNNKAFYKWHLDSIFAQNYDNYRVIHIEDASTDGSPELIRDYVKAKNQEHRFTLIVNSTRRGAMANMYRAISSCDDKAIIAIADGDDGLAHSNVLATLNKAYADPNVWLTYGQFSEYTTGNIGFCCQIPPHIVTTNRFREFSHQPSHLRTFYARLFKKILLEDLMYEGNFYPMTCDLATMMPMIEMTGERFKFIPEVLYIYNDINPLNDHKVSKDLQRKIDIHIRSKKRYKRLEQLF